MTPAQPSTKFSTTEDAAWLLFGFLVFALGTGAAAGSMLIAGGRVAIPVVLPVAALIVAGAAILELGLRRLHANLTGKRLSPWPLGVVSLKTVGQAILPTTMFEAGDRIGLNGRMVAACIYSLLLADLILLAAITG